MILEAQRLSGKSSHPLDGQDSVVDVSAPASIELQRGGIFDAGSLETSSTDRIALLGNNSTLNIENIIRSDFVPGIDHS